MINGFSYVRGLGSTGYWDSPTTRANVLRLAVKGSRRDRGILASAYGQTPNGGQEIISANDGCCINMTVGGADRCIGMTVGGADRYNTNTERLFPPVRPARRLVLPGGPQAVHPDQH